MGKGTKKIIEDEIMNILEKIDMYLTEGDDWVPGKWVVQKHSDFNIYMLLINKMKNGGWSAISISDDRPVAAKGSIKNAYPQPQPIDVKNVPPKLKAKVEKKAKQLNVNISEADMYVVSYRAKDKKGKVTDKKMNVKATSPEAAQAMVKRKSKNYYDGGSAKLSESYGNGLDSQHLQRNIKIVINDIKRDPDEKSMVGALKWVMTRLNQSFPDGDVTQDDIVDLLREPGARGVMKKAGTSAYEIIEYIWM